MSPWENIDNAFEPMISQTITINHGSATYSIHAHVMTDNNVDPYADTMDTDVKEINIVTKMSDVAIVSTLKRGDTISIVKHNQTKTYSIQDVLEDDVFGYIIKARSTNA